MRERDSQLQRLYKCDPALISLSKELPTVKDVERYTKKVFASKRVRAAFPKATRYHLPYVKDGRRRRSSCGSWSGISIIVAHRNEAVVLHELAHVICQREYSYRVAGHGWQFCSIYLKLALYLMGREAHDALKQAMKANRVRFTAPRKRKPLDPERKAALIARLAAYRAAQQQVAA